MALASKGLSQLPCCALHGFWVRSAWEQPLSQPLDVETVFKSPMKKGSRALRSWVATIWPSAERRVHLLTASSQQMWAFHGWTQCSSEWLLLAQIPQLAQLVGQCFLPAPALPWIGIQGCSWPGVPPICHLKSSLPDEPADTMMPCVPFKLPPLFKQEMSLLGHNAERKVVFLSF